MPEFLTHMDWLDWVSVIGFLISAFSVQIGRLLRHGFASWVAYRRAARIRAHWRDYRSCRLAASEDYWRDWTFDYWGTRDLVEIYLCQTTGV